MAALEYRQGLTRFNAPPAQELLKPNAGAEEAAAKGAQITGEFARVTARQGEISAEIGEKAGRAIAQGGEALGRSLENYGELADRHATTQELTSGVSAATQLMVGTTDAMHQAAQQADPNDPHPAMDWLKSHGNDIWGQFADDPNFTTDASKRWAAEQSATHVTELYRQAMAIDSERAGQAAVSNVHTTVNSLAGLVDQHPEQLQSALAQFDRNADAMVAGLPPALQGKVRADLQAGKGALYDAAINSTLRANPNADVSALAAAAEKGGYLTPEQIQAIPHVQKFWQHSALADQTRQREQDTLQFQQSASQLENSFVVQRPDGSVTLQVPANFGQSIMNLRKMPGAQYDKGELQTIVQMSQRVMNETNNGTLTQTDPATLSTLRNRIFDPQNPLSGADVVKAFVDGKLSRQDYLNLGSMAAEYGRLNPVVRGQASAALETARHALTDFDQNPSGIGPSLQSESAYQHFVTWFLPTFQQQLAAGKAPADIIDKLVTPDRLAQFAWQAGESGDAIKNILPPKPQLEEGGAFKSIGHFFGDLWNKSSLSNPQGNQ